MRRRTWTAVVVCCLCHAGWLGAAVAGAQNPKSGGEVVKPAVKPVAGDDVFDSGKFWNVHLTISPKEYAALTPPSRGFFEWLAGKPKVVKPDEPVRTVHRNNFGVDLPWVTGSVTLGEQTFHDIGIRYKGNGSFGDAGRTIAKSFKIDLDHFDGDETFDGMRTINLHCGVTDPSHCREPLGYRLYRAAGVPASRTVVAEVWLTVPGKYAKEPLGAYTIIEHVDKRFLRANFGSDKGLLMKPEGVSDLSYLGERWEQYKDRYAPKREATPEESKRVIAFTKLITQAGDKEFREKIASFVDMDAYLRFLAATAFVVNPDSFYSLGHNFYLYLHPTTEKFHFMPWDLDRAFANFPIFGSHAQQMNLSFARPYFGNCRLNDRILAMPEMKTRYQSLLKDLSETCFERERVLKQFDAFETGIKGPLERGTKAAAARKERNSLPFDPPPLMKTFLEKRTESLTNQVAGVSTGHVPNLWLGLFQKKDPPAEPKKVKSEP